MTRAEYFAKGQLEGGHWLLECRDMWDAFDDDGGVYFKIMASDGMARREVRDIQANPQDKRLLAAYDLRKPLAEQGAGLTLEEFLQRQASPES